MQKDDNGCIKYELVDNIFAILLQPYNGDGRDHIKDTSS